MRLDETSDVEFDPSTLAITAGMLRLVAELDEFKGAWRLLGRLAPDRLSALRHVATIESAGSSTRIEGARLSDREVQRLLSNVESRSFASRDEQEVAGYAETMELVFRSFADFTLTENHIKQLHRDLLGHTQKDERHRGEYKTLPNHVEAFGPGGKNSASSLKLRRRSTRPDACNNSWHGPGRLSTKTVCIRCSRLQSSSWSSWPFIHSRTAMDGFRGF